MKVEIVRTLSRNKDESGRPYIDFWAVVSSERYYRIKTVFGRDNKKLVEPNEKLYENIDEYLATLKQ